MKIKSTHKKRGENIYHLGLLQLRLNFLWLLFIVTLPGTLYAAIDDEANFYTPPANYNVTKNLVTDYNVDNSFSTDDSQVLQQAIDDITAAGGGKLVISAGDYTLSEISIPSNVHIEIDSGTTIRPSTRPDNKNYDIFKIGEESPNTVAPTKNVSIVGINGNFTIDLRYANNKNVRCFFYRNCSNFYLANLTVLDTKSIFAAVEYGGVNVDGTVYGPTNGILKNIEVYDAHYGYGMVQVQYGRNILFKNLFGLGGTTLRLESHYKTYFGTDCSNYIDDIVGRGISSENGNSSVMLSPHFVKNGYVDISDITSKGSGFAVRVEKGYTTSDEQAAGLTPGWFHSTSALSDIKATFTLSEAQLKEKHFQYMPCYLRPYIVEDQGSIIYSGPSIAAVVDRDNYDLQVDESEITVSGGFRSSEKIVTDIDSKSDTECSGIEADNDLLAIYAPSNVQAGQTSEITMDYTTNQTLDLHVELIQKRTGEIIEEKQTAISTVAGAKDIDITIPADANGEYLWRAWTSLPGSTYSNRLDELSQDVIIRRIFYIVNRFTNKKIQPVADSLKAPIILAPLTATHDSVKWEKVDAGDGYFYLKNVATGMFFRPNGVADYAPLYQCPTSWNGDYTRWTQIETDGDYFHLQNKSTGKFIRPEFWADGCNILQYPTSSTGNWTQWSFVDVITATNLKSATAKQAITNNTDIRIYPTPTTDFLNIILDIDVQPNAIIQILNLQGKTVMAERLEVSNKLDVHDLKCGVYIAHIINGNNTTLRKIIKQ